MIQTRNTPMPCLRVKLASGTPRVYQEHHRFNRFSNTQLKKYICVQSALQLGADLCFSTNVKKVVLLILHREIEQRKE